MKTLFVGFLFAVTVFAADYPEWILNPNINDTFGAVGYAAPLEDKKLQKKIALVDARAKLSESIKIHIENQTTKTASSDGNKTFETSSTQTSNNLIKNAKVKAEFTDEKGGFYVWMIMVKK